ncbi:histidine--tRNA ligase [Tropheryma whipplei]|uniref:histidine--tRNA ligase n=1 Tax=Tropheryma whipplei TaxID=2039 RepID=UPI0004ADAD2D|nr:histidine--tRNA ligase [Tropheryma whipplei]
MKIVPPRGMQDFLPHEKEHRDRITEVIYKSYISHGFNPIETPSLENIERLACGVGQENEKLTYKIIRRGLTGAQTMQHPDELIDLGLRFDLTIPLVRFWNTNRARLPKIFRSLQIGHVWRAEKPQKGRRRQFIQCDIDIIGQPEILAEIELLVATLSTLEQLGIRTPKLHINDRRILFSMLNNLGVPHSCHVYVSIVLDKLRKIGLDLVKQELCEFPALVAYLASSVNSNTGSTDLCFDVSSTKDITHIRRTIQSALPHGCKFDCEDLCRIIASVNEFTQTGVFFDPLLVRGMGYYTGPIFEILHDDYSIAGGGRYDGLVERLGGLPTPACGFSIGFERVLGLIKESVSLDPKKMILLYDPKVDPNLVVSVKLEFISKGFIVRPELASRSRRNQIELAKREGFGAFLYLDPLSPPDGLLAKVKPIL